MTEAKIKEVVAGLVGAAVCPAPYVQADDCLRTCDCTECWQEYLASNGKARVCPKCNIVTDDNCECGG